MGLGKLGLVVATPKLLSSAPELRPRARLTTFFVLLCFHPFSGCSWASSLATFAIGIANSTLNHSCKPHSGMTPVQQWLARFVGRIQKLLRYERIEYITIETGRGSLYQIQQAQFEATELHPLPDERFPTRKTSPYKMSC